MTRESPQSADTLVIVGTAPSKVYDFVVVPVVEFPALSVVVTEAEIVVSASSASFAPDIAILNTLSDPLKATVPVA